LDWDFKAIAPVPAEDPSKPMSRQEHIEVLGSKGLDVIENADGSVTTRPQRSRSP
jgi:hypothetical protein